MGTLRRGDLRPAARIYIFREQAPRWRTWIDPQRSATYQRCRRVPICASQILRITATDAPLTPTTYSARKLRARGVQSGQRGAPGRVPIGPPMRIWPSPSMPGIPSSVALWPSATLGNSGRCDWSTCHAHPELEPRQPRIDPPTIRASSRRRSNNSVLRGIQCWSSSPTPSRTPT